MHEIGTIRVAEIKIWNREKSMPKRFKTYADTFSKQKKSTIMHSENFMIKLSALFTSGTVRALVLYTALRGASYLHQRTVLACGAFPITESPCCRFLHHEQAVAHAWKAL